MTVAFSLKYSSPMYSMGTEDLRREVRRVGRGRREGGREGEERERREGGRRERGGGTGEGRNRKRDGE